MSTKTPACFTGSLLALSLVTFVACAGAPKEHSSTPALAARSASSGAGGAPSGATAPACVALAKICHGHDDHSETARACHEMGHAAASNAGCEAKRDECMAACKR